jgi:glycosyltransferase involved in cell wall biosynthesis
MQKRGHTCTVLAQRDLSYREKDPSGISIQRFDFNAILEKKDLKEMRSIRNYLDQLAKEFQPDIIYLNTVANGSAFAFLLFRNLFTAPVVATMHTPYFFEGEIPPITKQVMDQADCICCASQWGLQVMEKLLPLRNPPLKMIYYGLKNPAIVPHDLPFSPPTLLLYGRLSSEKGFEVGIEAFHLLLERGIEARLVIGGEGAERPFLESLVDRWNLRSRTHFTGFLNREEVYQWINQATFIVMPSHFEAFGLVAFESMQLGRPVIASHVGGLPEIVAHRERGLLVPPNDPRSFSIAMQELIENPEKTKEMGQAAYEWAQESYSLHKNVNQYEQIFCELMR